LSFLTFTLNGNPILSESDGYLSFPDELNHSSLPYGYPDVPVKRLVNIDVSTLTIECISEDTIYLNKEIYPKQYPVSKSQERVLFIKDRNAYQSDKPLFSSSYRIYSDNTAEIYPYDYIPSKNILIVRGIQYDYSNLNPKESSNSVCVIYNDIFSGQISELSEFYRKRGFSFKSHPLSVTGSGAQEIEEFIKNAYSLEPFSYVLLLGSSELLPYITGSGTDYPATDLYYSLIDTMDYFPDLFLSRIPAKDTADLINYISKVKTEYSSGRFSYNNKGYFIATNDGGWHLLAESSHVYAMSVMREVGYECDSFFGYYLTGTPLDTAFNDGRGISVYSGHGSAYSWSGPSYDQSNIESLSNESMHPIVMSFACLTGNYSIPDYFGYMWLKNPDKGATTFIGASQYTYWEQDDVLQRAFFDSLASSSSIADAMNKAKNVFYQEYGDAPLTRGYYERYNYFTLPETYFGNNSISDFSFNADKYQPASLNTIDGNANFSGILSQGGFLGVFVDDSLIDSSHFSSNSSFMFDVSSALLNAGDSVDLSVYVPGNYYESKKIHMIKDGQFVSLSSYNLTDYRIDTFFFDLSFKNYGTTVADSSKVLITGYEDIFNLLSNDIVIFNLLPDSYVTIPNGIIFEINGYSDSLVSAVCSIGTINGNDTVYEVLILDLLKPDFNISFKNAYFEAETLDYILLGAYSTLAFNIANLSPLKSKDISIEINSKSFFCLDNVEIIDSLGSYETKAFSFDVFTYSSSQPLCSLDIIVSIGNYSDTTKIILPTRYNNSEMYLGPVNNYYIFTNDMTDFENSPKFKYINIDSFAFRQLEVTDDTTLSIKLPFIFNFYGESSETLYFNTNGIFSLHRLPFNLYSSEPLPTHYLSNPAIFTGWLDYRCEYYNDIYMKPSDAVNTCFSYFDTLNYQFIIYYNKVIGEEMPYTFAVCIDTSDITVHYYNIPDSSKMIMGIQFNSSAYLSLTDSAYSDEFTPRNGMSVKITNKRPILKNKFTQIYQKKLEKPAINSVAFLPKSSLVNISISKSGYYEILLFDASGRLIDRVYEGIIFESQSNYRIESHSGVAFLIIRDDAEVLVSKKLVLF